MELDLNGIIPGFIKFTLTNVCEDGELLLPKQHMPHRRALGMESRREASGRPGQVLGFPFIFSQMNSPHLVSRDVVETQILLLSVSVTAGLSQETSRRSRPNPSPQAGT